MSALGAPRAKLIVAFGHRRVEYTNGAILHRRGGWRPPIRSRNTVAQMPASLELVKIALQAYGNGDCEIALALADPLSPLGRAGLASDGDLVWGHDKVAAAMRRYLDSWEAYRFELEDIAEVGPGKVVGICRERGKPKDGSRSIGASAGSGWSRTRRSTPGRPT